MPAENVVFRPITRQFLKKDTISISDRQQLKSPPHTTCVSGLKSMILMISLIKFKNLICSDSAFGK